jgi:hypothetical protein
MNRIVSQVRKPVKRQGADNYLLVILLSFAASVSLTRLFLELTGYPQLGGGGLHIAHVLWGGLLLFIAALLPLLLANRWVYVVSALLTGSGVGLFIDEVGKFITQNNNYFYPVLIYLRARRHSYPDARTEMYHVLDALQEVLDHDLEPMERDRLAAQLHHIRDQADFPSLSQLADGLLQFLESDRIDLAPETAGLIEKLFARLHEFEERHTNRRRFRAMLIGTMLALGLFSVFKLVVLVSQTALQASLSTLVQQGILTSSSSLDWFTARLVLEAALGFLLLVAAGLMLIGQEGRALSLSYIILLVSLTTVDLLIFYFDQFSTIITAIVQFSLLIGVIYYRRRYRISES